MVVDVCVTIYFYFWVEFDMLGSVVSIGMIFFWSVLVDFQMHFLLARESYPASYPGTVVLLSSNRGWHVILFHLQGGRPAKSRSSSYYVSRSVPRYLTVNADEASTTLTKLAK